MNSLLRAVLALPTLASCASSAAPAPAVPRPPSLAAPLDSLAFYVGSWQCKGTSFASGTDPEAHWDARVVVAPELDGKWISVQMIGPGPNRTIEHKGYDEAAKRWRHVAVLNDGSWGSVSSVGWSGSQMVFTPDDKSDTTHATFTKLGERSYSHEVARDSDNAVVWKKVCSKS